MRIFVYAHMPPPSSTTELLVALAEPTRLRILKEANLVRDTPIAQFVLYRLQRESGVRGRLLTAALEALGQEERMRTERHEASDRSRANPRVRLATPVESSS
jgi:hypothetical protein